MFTTEELESKKRVKLGPYYALIFPEHPNAFGRGYVYEHRARVEARIGRYLQSYEEVHHIDGNKHNNADENLQFTEARDQHKSQHRGPKSILRKPGEENPAIECGCGCGGKLPKYDKHGRPRRFLPYHSRIGTSRHTTSAFVPCACGCGLTLKPFDKDGRPRRYISGHNGRCLPDSLVEQIRAEYIPWKVTAVQLSRKYGLALGRVYRILEGRTFNDASVSNS